VSDRYVDSSLNQVAMGAIGEWLFGAIGGIAPLGPGWKTIRIAPRPAGSLRWARVTAPTPYGQVSCAWERSNGLLRLEASIPSNTTAVLDLGDGSRLIEPGRHRIQGFDRSTACGCNANNERKILTPSEVIMPLLLPGMVKRHNRSIN